LAKAKRLEHKLRRLSIEQAGKEVWGNGNP
jgi:hypothetical protein